MKEGKAGEKGFSVRRSGDGQQGMRKGGKEGERQGWR